MRRVTVSIVGRDGKTVQNYLRASKAEQSTYEWNQPQTFRMEVTWCGIRIDCLNCRDGGNVVLSLAESTPDGRPTFHFKCACGNEAKRTVFNAASGFPLC